MTCILNRHCCQQEVVPVTVPTLGHPSVWHCMAQGSVAGGESCGVPGASLSISPPQQSLHPVLRLRSLLAPLSSPSFLCLSKEMDRDTCGSVMCFSGFWELDLWDDCFHRAGVHRHPEGQELPSFFQSLIAVIFQCVCMCCKIGQ